MLLFSLFSVVYSLFIFYDMNFNLIAASFLRFLDLYFGRFFR